MRDFGATYHTGSVSSIGFEPDVIVECTGVGQVIADSIRAIGTGGIVFLTGVGSGGTRAARHGRRRGRGGASQQRRCRQRQRQQAASLKAGEALAARTILARAPVTRRERPEDFATRSSASQMTSRS